MILVCDVATCVFYLGGDCSMENYRVSNQIRDKSVIMYGSWNIFISRLLFVFSHKIMTWLLLTGFVRIRFLLNHEYSYLLKIESHFAQLA